MKIEDKQKIWSLIEKYDGVLDTLTNSLSKVLQNKAVNTDFKMIFSCYTKMSVVDTKLVDEILGQKILFNLI
jgi:hypothetical protein